MLAEELQEPDRGEERVDQRRESDGEDGHEDDARRARQEVKRERGEQLTRDHRDADMAQRPAQSGRGELREPRARPEGQGEGPEEEKHGVELRTHDFRWKGAASIDPFIGGALVELKRPAAGR